VVAGVSEGEGTVVESPDPFNGVQNVFVRIDVEGEGVVMG
jgi:hypothetical protein